MSWEPEDREPVRPPAQPTMGMSWTEFALIIALVAIAAIAALPWVVDALRRSASGTG